VTVLHRLLVEPFALPFMQRALWEALLLGVLGGIVSVFVVLRRLAFVSDVMTHTIFPGVVIGFLVAHTDGIVWGALLFAVLSAVLLTVLSTNRRVPEDSTLAILLTGFFSVGVVLVSRRASFTADLTTFLFGRILYVDSRQLAETAAMTVTVLLVLGLTAKELLLRAVDPAGAAAQGYRVPLLDLMLNLLIALVVVAAVKAVGTVLVIALLVVPAAAARLVSDRLRTVFLLSVGFGCLARWFGLAASYEASVNHGHRLASGATVVLVLVAFYVVGFAIGAVRRRRRAGPVDRAATPVAAPGGVRS
jgi:manganese/iron transport system permease protein